MQPRAGNAQTLRNNANSSASAHRAEEYTLPDAADEVVVLEMLGLSITAVLLPSELLTEDRVTRMNRFWDLVDEREALVVAVSEAGER